MISVVVPTLNAADKLAATLLPLIRAAVDGLVREVVVADGGSTDATFEVADDAGAVFLAGPADEAARIASACAVAKGPWLLVLRPGLRLESAWAAAAKAHIEDHPNQPAHFRLALDDHRASARLKEVLAAFTGADASGAVLTPKRLYQLGKVGRSRALPARVFRT